MNRLLLISLGLSLGCGGVQAEPEPAPSRPGAPWIGSRLSSAQVPAAFRTEWQRAENRSRCAILAPASLTDTERSASVRGAHFGGGWGVAYDLPGERSAFGIAGTGVRAGQSATYRDWPHQLTYADGSWAGYGLEGGSGPKWLAYVEIPGQDCLYNVWSHRGQAHLESLISRLRLAESQ